jgi:hypothetical protein
MKIKKPESGVVLTPRQGKLNPASPSFGNCYRSAITAGYSDQTARNLMHLNPSWLSDNIGHLAQSIQPEQLTQVLSAVIYSDNEPTLIRLKAAELMMRYHGMLRQQTVKATIAVNVDLTGYSESTVL